MRDPRMTGLEDIEMRGRRERKVLKFHDERISCLEKSYSKHRELMIAKTKSFEARSFLTPHSCKPSEILPPILSETNSPTEVQINMERLGV
jgi:hypothetical protein